MQIKFIAQSGQAVLVEWIDKHPKRAIVPAGIIDGNDLDVAQLEAGVRYGVDWETFGVDFAGALLAQGIWTWGDLQSKIGIAKQICAKYKIGIETIIFHARKAAWVGGNK